MTRAKLLLFSILLLPACGKGDPQKGSETPAADDTSDLSETSEDTESADSPADSDGGETAAAPGPGGLQVLPADIDPDELKGIMKGMSNSLGVMCDHCHVDDDMASDANPMKVKARSMMLMTMALNKEHFGGEQVITCKTCHQGQAEPPQ